jgi:hypothetical protein
MFDFVFISRWPAECTNIHNALHTLQLGLQIPADKCAYALWFLAIWALDTEPRPVEAWNVIREADDVTVATN